MAFDPLKEAGTRLVSNLVPPGTPNSQRWKYDATVSISLVVLMTHMAWACGLLIFVGLHGFTTTDVSAAQYNSLQGEIANVSNKSDSQRRSIEITQNQIQLLIIKANLKNAMKDLCSAQRTGNQAALESIEGDLETLEDQYRALTSWDYKRPSCDVVLVGGAK